MMKRLMSYIFFVLLFVAVFFAQGVRAQILGDCDESQTILKLSGTTNAHGEVYNMPFYTNKVCFTDFFERRWEGERNLLGAILKLSGDTNAHAEAPTQNNYNTFIKYGDLTCVLKQPGEICDNINNRPAAIILELSANTNAHLALPGGG